MYIICTIIIILAHPHRQHDLLLQRRPQRLYKVSIIKILDKSRLVFMYIVTFTYDGTMRGWIRSHAQLYSTQDDFK